MMESPVRRAGVLLILVLVIQVCFGDLKGNEFVQLVTI